MATKEIVKGEVFIGTIEEVNQERISSDKVKEFLSADDLKQVINEVSFEQLKITRISGKKTDFVMPNLDNATISGLLDQIGELREKMKDDKKLEGILKTALDARLLERKKEQEAEAKLAADQS